MTDSRKYWQRKFDEAKDHLALRGKPVSDEDFDFEEFFVATQTLRESGRPLADDFDMVEHIENARERKARGIDIDYDKEMKKLKEPTAVVLSFDGNRKLLTANVVLYEDAKALINESHPFDFDIKGTLGDKFAWEVGAFLLGLLESSHPSIKATFSESYEAIVDFPRGPSDRNG